MKKLSALGLSAATYFSLAFPVLAQVNAAKDIDPCPKSETAGFTNFNLLCKLGLEGNLISNVVTILFIVATLIALAFLIYGGIRWITSGGDKTGVETARNTIVAALVGLVIVFLSYFILRVIFGLFGITLENLNLPSLNLFAPAAR